MAKKHLLYAAEFRRQMIELVRTGRTPEELAKEFEPSAQAIRNWRAAPTWSMCMTSSTRNSARPFLTVFYDIGADAGCVSVGIDHDTAEFAVNAIGRWHETSAVVVALALGASRVFAIGRRKRAVEAVAAIDHRVEVVTDISSLPQIDVSAADMLSKPMRHVTIDCGAYMPE